MCLDYSNKNLRKNVLNYHNTNTVMVLKQASYIKVFLYDDIPIEVLIFKHLICTCLKQSLMCLNSFKKKKYFFIKMSENTLFMMFLNFKQKK